MLKYSSGTVDLSILLLLTFTISLPSIAQISFFFKKRGSPTVTTLHLPATMPLG